MNNEYLINSDKSITVGTDDGFKHFYGNYAIEDCEQFLIEENAIETLQNDQDRLTSDILRFKKTVREEKKEILTTALITVGGTAVIYIFFKDLNLDYVVNFPSPLVPTGIFDAVCIGIWASQYVNYKRIKKHIVLLENKLKAVNLLIEKQKEKLKQQTISIEQHPKAVNLHNKTRQYLLELREEIERFSTVIAKDSNDSLENGNQLVKKNKEN